MNNEQQQTGMELGERLSRMSNDVLTSYPSIGEISALLAEASTAIAADRQQQAGVELSEGQLDELIAEHFSGMDYDEVMFRNFARDAISADRQQRGKVEPVAEVSHVVGAGSNDVGIRWNGGLTQVGAKLYAAPQAEKAPSVQLLQSAIDRIKDMLLDDDGQAFKEARKFIERYELEKKS